MTRPLSALRIVVLVLLVVLIATPLFAQQAPLDIVVHSATRPDASGALPVTLTLVNRGSSDMTVESLRSFAVEPLAPAGGEGWSCTGGREIACSYAGTLAPGASTTPVTLSMTFPSTYGRSRLTVFATVRAEGSAPQSRSIEAPVVSLRAFTVTNANDSGSGSLRAAMNSIASDSICASGPCVIEFAIPGGGSGGVHTIHLASPLPLLEIADLVIDGSSQAAFAGGDPNPHGPEIELRGTALTTSSDGLAVRAQRLEVRGLAIGGFGGNGIFFIPRERFSTFLFERNYIGVDATGSMAVANGLRGIMISEGYVRSSAVRDNVLSGNRRSGFFVSAKQSPFNELVPSMVVERNRIGVAAHSDLPIPNGASGIYFGPGTDGAAVRDNVIANNLHWGIATALGARMVNVGVNRIAGNLWGSIDIGLDGPTPGNIQGRVAPTGVLTSAKYDPVTNTTTITGHGEWMYAGLYFITPYTFYASDRPGDLEQFLGSVQPNVEGRFVFRVTGDLRGRWITSIATRTMHLDGSFLRDTSEPAPPLLFE